MAKYELLHRITVNPEIVGGKPIIRGMRTALELACLFLWPLAGAADSALAATPVGIGRNQLFTEDWKFFLGDNAKAKDPLFADTSWRTLDLPHDWSVEGAFDPKLASCTAFLPCGTAWYRKTFTPGVDAGNQSVSIRFDGVMNHCTVWCNGRQVGGRPYGYSSFTCDLTPAIQPGTENVIAVRVNHADYADSRWYAGSGIYRNVFLSITGKLHIDTNGIFVSTPKVAPDSADIDVQTTVCNDAAVAAEATVVTLIKDDQGRTVASRSQTELVPAGGRKLFAALANVAQPALWSPDHPNMYCAQTLLKVRETKIDKCDTPFGIRTFAFDAVKGFSLNGQGAKLKGVCLHHDAGALGAAVPPEVWRRRLRLLKDAGCNAIRSSHNPPAPEFLDLCDRLGFLVMDEAFDEWTRGKKWIVGHNVGQPGTDGYHSDFNRWADIDIRDMVLRDRNHPSIILWSIGNEIDYMNDPYPPDSPELPAIAQRLINDVKAVDRTRPVTAACASPSTNLYKKLLDVEGYNYMERLFDDDHAANPTRVIYGSENSHARNRSRPGEQ